MELFQNKNFSSLMKDEENNMVSGVVSGIGQFTGINTTVLRIVLAALVALGLIFDWGFVFVLTLAYIGGMFLMSDYSKENDKRTFEYRAKTGSSSTGD